jgi:hypothetical protein
MTAVFPLLLLPAMLFLFPVSSFAQDYDYRGEVFGGFGWTRIRPFAVFGTPPDVNGLSFIGGAGWRPFSHVGFEFVANVMRYDFTSGVSREEGTAVFYTGNLLYHFIEDELQPYLSVGLGGLYGRSTERRSLSDGGTVESSSSGSGGIGTLGGGVKIFLKNNISLRLDVRSALDTGLNTHLGGFVAIGYHW